MANDINLKSGSGITLELNTDSDTLSITINKAGLNDILKDLKDDDGSVLKSILNSITDLTTRVSALENHAAGVTENWVKGLIDKYSVNATNGLLDYGTGDPSSSANSRAKIYVKY